MVCELGVDPAEVPDAPPEPLALALAPEAPEEAAPEVVEAAGALPEAEPEAEAVGTGATPPLADADIVMPEDEAAAEEAGAIDEAAVELAAAELEVATSPCATVKVPD